VVTANGSTNATVDGVTVFNITMGTTGKVKAYDQRYRYRLRLPVGSTLKPNDAKNSIN